jgi:hypothetical protein
MSEVVKVVEPSKESRAKATKEALQRLLLTARGFGYQDERLLRREQVRIRKAYPPRECREVLLCFFCKVRPDVNTHCPIVPVGCYFDPSDARVEYFVTACGCQGPSLKGIVGCDQKSIPLEVI